MILSELTAEANVAAAVVNNSNGEWRERQGATYKSVNQRAGTLFPFHTYRYAILLITSATFLEDVLGLICFDQDMRSPAWI